jgi:hypothetical protein
MFFEKNKPARGNKKKMKREKSVTKHRKSLK